MFSIHTTLEEFENEDFTLKTHQMFSIHTTPEEFENEGFTLKTHQMFSIHTTLEEFENASITRAVFERLRFQNVFCPHENETASVFRFIRFEKCFQKAPFWCWISVHGRANRRHEAMFSNSSGVVWMTP